MISNEKKIIIKDGMSQNEVDNLLGTNYKPAPDKEYQVERRLYYIANSRDEGVLVRFKNQKVIFAEPFLQSSDSINYN